MRWAMAQNNQKYKDIAQSTWFKVTLVTYIFSPIVISSTRVFFIAEARLSQMYSSYIPDRSPIMQDQVWFSEATGAFQCPCKISL